MTKYRILAIREDLEEIHFEVQKKILWWWSTEGQMEYDDELASGWRAFQYNNIWDAENYIRRIERKKVLMVVKEFTIR